MKCVSVSSSALVFCWVVATTIPSSSCLVTFQTVRKVLTFQSSGSSCKDNFAQGVQGKSLKNAAASDSTSTTSRTTTTAGASSTDVLSADGGGKPGTAVLDVPWEGLGFEFRPTKSHLRMTYKDGAWGPMELQQVKDARIIFVYYVGIDAVVECQIIKYYILC
jgi:hypothetical protein